jgi:hypothetical protein
VKKLIFALLSVTLVMASACHKEECKKGLALKDNLKHLASSLKDARSQQSYMTDLCKWIEDSEIPYLRASGDHLEKLSDKINLYSCDTFDMGNGNGLCPLRHDAKASANQLAASLKGQFAIIQNLNEMCQSYRAKGMSSDVQFYLQDTVNQINNPVSQGSANTLLNIGRCGGEEPIVEGNS